MTDRGSDTKNDACQPKFLRRVFLCALLLELITLIGVAIQSDAFRYGSVESARPILLIVALFSVAFIAQMTAIWAAIRLPDSAAAKACFISVAIAFRLLFFVTAPIQEVDLYRYLWDGAVACEGISPYRYSPESIVTSFTQDPQLQRLQTITQERPGLATVRDRVHYPQVTTVYPPVSQLVFAITAWLIPSAATVTTHVASIKAMIIVFDLATLLLLIKLLRETGVHTGWSLAYGWSPLVLKEFANSGHLDSIAVCATVAAVLLMVRLERMVTYRGIIASAICLGLGVGAKLFPVVLFPVCAAYLVGRTDVRKSILWCLVATVTSAVSLAPMMIDHLDPPEIDQADQEGLATFLSQWEMNDLIFMIVSENLRPDPIDPTQPKMWFALAPDELRSRLTEKLANRFSLDPASVPFLVTRAITSVAFLLLAFALAWRVRRDPHQFLPIVFLTLAWFWLLAPTQNPWYWTWALPFVAFNRNRAWLLMAAATMLYYCRFWCDYHDPQLTFLGQDYTGVAVFDFVVVWFEFVPVLGFVLLGSIRLSRRPESANRNAHRVWL